MRQRPRRNRRGFTLMEVLLVMAILVVMASMVTFAFLTIQRNANSDAAFNQAATLSNACEQYKLNVGVYPQKLEDLIKQPQGMSVRKWKGPYLKSDTIPVDPWGQEYDYQADNLNNRVTISSMGPDGQKGSDDDINSNERN